MLGSGAVVQGDSHAGFAVPERHSAQRPFVTIADEVGRFGHIGKRPFLGVIDPMVVGCVVMGGVPAHGHSIDSAGTVLMIDS